jgi:subtilase family serine protease
MSWGINEVPNETQWDSIFNVPGVTFVAASGDSGVGTIWPAVSPYVVGVGGTTLRLNSAGNIFSETGWGSGNLSFFFGGSGGGFSQYESLSLAPYQQGVTTTENGFSLTSFGRRLSPDVAYDANPNTGFPVLDGADGGWFAVGGTSAGAPQWAALIAIADAARVSNGLSPLSSTQTLTALYSTAFANAFNDITSGSTGAYQVVNSSNRVIGTIPVTAVKGYDLVTGLGTPKAAQLITDLANVPSVQQSVKTAATSTSSSTSSSSSSGSSSNSHPLVLTSTAGSTTATTNDLATFQAVQVLTSAAGTQATLPQATGIAGFTPAFAVASVLPPVLVTPASSSAVLLSKNSSGGGGDDLADQGNQSAVSQPTAPANPSAASFESPAPQKADPAPVVPEDVDAVFLQGERVSQLFDGSGWAALAIENTGLATRPRLNALLLGLAAVVVLFQHDPRSRPQARDRGSPRVQVPV